MREMAPIIVHLNLDKMLKFMEADTHYRNQLLGAVEIFLGGAEVRNSHLRRRFHAISIDFTRFQFV